MLYGKKSSNKRVNPARSEKNDCLDRQKNKCKRCGKLLTPSITEFHHKDGNRSNWKSSNIVAICKNCHGLETNKQRVVKVQKSRRAKSRSQNNPFGSFKMKPVKMPKIRF